MAINGEPPKHYQDWPNDAGFDAREERREPVQLEISGTLPPSCAGTLYRTGPGSYKVPNAGAEGKTYALSHWFDGFSHLHRFQIVPSAEDPTTCRVLYNSRRQVDELIELARRNGRLDGITFAQKRDPCETFFQKVKTTFAPAHHVGQARSPGMMDIAVTVHANVPGIADGMKVGRTADIRSLTSMTDNHMLKFVDPETLEPMGVAEQAGLHPDLKGPISCAHAQYDAATGDAYNYNLEFGRHPTYRVFHTSAATGETEILATISGAHVKPAYVHSFFMTADYIVLCVWPAVFAAAGMRILWERNIVDAMDFQPGVKARWFVVDRTSPGPEGGRGLVATFLSDPFFSFHSVNAWQEPSKESSDEEEEEEEEDLVCDIITYDDMAVMQRFYYENMVSDLPGVGAFHDARKSYPSLVQYRLAGIPRKGAKAEALAPATADKDLPRAEVVRRYRGEHVGDLPVYNPRFATRKSRYVYNVVDRGLSSFFDGLAKVDMETGEYTLWGRAKHTPSEPIFVPKNNNSSSSSSNSASDDDDDEDAGHLLTVVLNGETGTSYLLCLDARTMKEVGRATCDVPVSFGLHGQHIPSRT